MFAPVVIKVVRPDMVDNAAVLQGLSREADLTDRLRHPLIVRSYFADLNGPRPCVALEMLPGEPLDVILAREGKLSLDRTLDVGLGLATALHYLRNSDVVHLDVRPANVMLGSVPRLIDFNLSFPAEQAALLTGQVGTRGYLAPEQCAPPETGVPCYATDVWGLGATLFKAIAGRRPFALGSWDASDSLEAQFPPLRETPRALPGETPLPLANVVMACLAKDPAQRPTPATVFAELKKIQGGVRGSTTKSVGRGPA
jgi:serine/threonine protein kinase